MGRSDYRPFGETWGQTGTLPRQRFTGQARDGEADLDDFNARAYQPRHGRFTRPDPVYGNLFQPQSWNRYVYVMNRPMVMADPSGATVQYVWNEALHAWYHSSSVHYETPVGATIEPTVYGLTSIGPTSWDLADYSINWFENGGTGGRGWSPTSAASTGTDAGTDDGTDDQQKPDEKTHPDIPPLVVQIKQATDELNKAGPIGVKMGCELGAHLCWSPNRGLYVSEWVTSFVPSLGRCDASSVAPSLCLSGSIPLIRLHTHTQGIVPTSEDMKNLGGSLIPGMVWTPGNPAVVYLYDYYLYLTMTNAPAVWYSGRR